MRDFQRKLKVNLVQKDEVFFYFLSRPGFLLSSNNYFKSWDFSLAKIFVSKKNQYKIKKI